MARKTAKRRSFKRKIGGLKNCDGKKGVQLTICIKQNALESQSLSEPKPGSITRNAEDEYINNGNKLIHGVTKIKNDNNEGIFYDNGQYGLNILTKEDNDGVKHYKGINEDKPIEIISGGGQYRKRTLRRTRRKRRTLR
jgi:hypothetical protein